MLGFIGPQFEQLSMSLFVLNYYPALTLSLLALRCSFDLTLLLYQALTMLGQQTHDDEVTMLLGT